jgi:hypothetical protein
MSVYSLPAVIGLKRAIQLAGAKGSVLSREPELVSRPGWLIAIQAKLRRLFMGPRIVNLVVFVDALNGSAEECMLGPGALQDTPNCGDRIPPRIDSCGAEQIARRVAFHSILKKNHTLWLPEFSITERLVVYLPLWSVTRETGARVWVNAVTGQVTREE